MEKSMVEELAIESRDEEQPQYIPSQLINSFLHTDGNTVHYHCYLIELKQKFTYEVSTSDVVLAVRCMLDPEVIESMEFEMCTDRGNLAVKFKYIGKTNFGLNEVFLCKKFQITLFGILSGYNMAKLEGILNELYRMEDNLEIDYLLLPSTTTHPIPFTICLSSSQDGCNNHVANVITKAGQVCSCELENSLVHTPDDDIFYIITGKMELDGNSLLRHKTHLTHENQQLYKGRRIFVVKNYLNKNRQVKQRESTKAPVELLPELCSIIISPISVSTIYSFSLIPSIMHRLESLLVAFDLKKVCMQNDIPTMKILEATTANGCQEKLSYESLETLGDSFLKYITSQHLFQTNPSDAPGLLTEKRKMMVTNANLCRLGCNSKLPGFIRTVPFDPKKWIIPGDKSINVTLKEVLVSDMTKMYYVGGNRILDNDTVSDVVEALIGAALITGGEKSALKFVDWIGLKVDFDITPNKRLLRIQHPETLLLESLLKYSFNDKSLLVEALTHGSYKPQELPNYQRLEFLGDSLLDLLVTEHLYKNKPGLSPGLLTDKRSDCVKNKILAWFAIKAGLHKHILRSSSDIDKNIDKTVKNFQESSFEPTSGWETVTYYSKVLADIIESLAGAIMVDSGFNKEVVLKSSMLLLGIN